MAFFNPLRPAYFQDPYPSLHRLRREDPVHWSRDLDAWVVTSHEHCLGVIQDDESFSSDPGRAGGPFGEEVRRKRAGTPLGGAPIMGNSDPPVHTALRSIVNRGFTPRAIESAREEVERAVAALLADLPTPGRPFDAIAQFAEPLAVSTVLQHLGIPREDFGRFREWSMALMRARAEGTAGAGVLEAAAQAREDMLGYLAQLTEQREAAAGETDNNVLSVLVDACDEGAIEPDEMLMMLIHISLAGNGPTAMAIGNALAALAAFPGVQERLRAEPELVPAAVEELLRFDSSTHFIVRFALRDKALGARTVRAGHQVHVMVGAANRDPARFADPDVLDIERADNRHLSFGHGIHFCLGAPLARLELQVALRRFLEHTGPFEVVEGSRAPSYQVRGYQRLILRELPR